MTAAEPGLTPPATSDLTLTPPAPVAAVATEKAGGMVPVVMAYVGDVLPVERRPLALGIVGAVDTAGWVIGPLYGALMVVLASWRLIFFINLPLSLAIGLALFVSRTSAAKGTNQPSRPTGHTVDWPGALSLTVAVAALIAPRCTYPSARRSHSSRAFLSLAVYAGIPGTRRGRRE